jgi:threonine dehydrogenase-like Zn-dependent dehydrogenase
MRAASIAEPGKIALCEVDVPDPGPDELRIRVEGCGVCGSNLGPWQGLPWLKYPLPAGDSGHEAWGIVDAVGKNVRHLAEGDRVAALSYRAYAEYDVADARHVLSIPVELAERAFPGEALACAMNIFERSRISGGQDVAIIGVGFLGALLTRLCTNAGANVIAISRRKFALKLAREMGARHTVTLDDHARIIERVRELTGGAFCDRVIEAVGKQWPLDLAAELTKTRGLLVVAGYHQDGPRQVNMQLWNWRGIDVVNAHERDQAVYLAGMQRALSSVLSGAVDPEPLYTHRFPLEQLDRALDATATRPEGFLKALVVP